MRAACFGLGLFSFFLLLLFSQNHSDGQDESGSIILMVSVYIKLFQTRSTACVWLCVHKRHICTKETTFFFLFIRSPNRLTHVYSLSALCFKSICVIDSERLMPLTCSPFPFVVFFIHFLLPKHFTIFFLSSSFFLAREIIKTKKKRRERRNNHNSNNSVSFAFITLRRAHSAER